MHSEEAASKVEKRGSYNGKNRLRIDTERGIPQRSSVVSKLGKVFVRTRTPSTLMRKPVKVVVVEGME